MTRLLLILAALVGLSSATLAQTKALPPGEIRANGEITFGNALKLGKREGGKTILQPDDVVSGSGVAAGVCDTSQWTGYVGGTASPALKCYATKQSKGIDIPFPAVIGIGPENFTDPPLPVNDQTFIQLAQHLIQAKTTQGDMRQESALVINMDVKTGKGRQTNHGQKVGLYMPVNVHPGAGNTWVMNPAMAILDGVGAQSMYVSEQDMTNFNGPYAPGGPLGNAAQTFRTWLGFPVTASELWSGETPGNSSITASTSNGSASVTFTGTLHVRDKISGAGIPNYTFVTAIDGNAAKVNATSGTATLNKPASATASGVNLTRETFNMFNGHLYQGAHLIRDNTFYDGTGSVNSIQIGGTHEVGINTTLERRPETRTPGLRDDG